MSESKSLAATTELRWWSDFAGAQTTVVKVLRMSPVLVALTVILGVLDELNFARAQAFGIHIAEYFVLLALSLRMVNEYWSELTGEPRKDPKRDMDKVSDGFTNGFIYSLLYGLGLLLFIVPGLYVLVSAALGIVFVCLEGKKGMPAFRASEQLIKGRWKFAAGYLVPPVLVFGGAIYLICIGASLAVEMVIDSGLSEAEAATRDLSIVSHAIWFFFGLWVTWCVLSQIALQVRLYKQLKEEKAEAAT